MSEGPKPKSRKKKSFPVMVFVIGTVTAIAAAGAGAGFYVYMGKQYETVFFPHTIINGYDVSNKTTEEVKDLISEGTEGYTLTIQGREHMTDQITGEEIGLHSVFDGSLEEYLEAQEPMRWWQSEGTEYEISTMLVYDEEKLKEKIDSLSCFSDEYAKEPVDAYLSDYTPGKGFWVVPEEPGTILNREKVAEGVTDAVSNLKPELNLEDLNAYKKPGKTSEDEALQVRAEELNRYVNREIIYLFGDEREVLDGDTIAQWMLIGEDGQVSFDAEQVAAYVKGLASKYDTAYQSKTLNTSYGPAVTITKGFYGWRMNQGEEADELYAVLESGESQTREPVYIQTANSHGENDYGDTYVEINLTAQHLFFYKDGELVIESDFVSGNHARGYDTPSGAYPLTYKQRNAVLKGQNYRTPVSYWMPFNGNIGMHDANWRGSFGGKIYMTNGSHGCINLPPSVAKVIFENISAGIPVLCYHLDGSDGKGSSGSKQGGSGQTAAQAQPAQTQPAQTQPAQTQPAQTEPAAEGGNPAQEPQQGTWPAEPETALEVPAGPGEMTPEETSPVPESPGEGGAGQEGAGSENPSGQDTESSHQPAGPHEAVFETTVEIGPGV